MSIGNVLVKFEGVDAADAGRLAAELASAVPADAPGTTASRVRTDPTAQDLGTDLLINFSTSGAVTVVFALIEKYLARRAKNARLTIDLGEVDHDLALAIAQSVDRKSWSPGLAAAIDQHTKPAG